MDLPVDLRDALRDELYGKIVRSRCFPRDKYGRVTDEAQCFARQCSQWMISDFERELSQDSGCISFRGNPVDHLPEFADKYLTQHLAILENTYLAKERPRRCPLSGGLARGLCAYLDRLTRSEWSDLKDLVDSLTEYRSLRATTTGDDAYFQTSAAGVTGFETYLQKQFLPGLCQAVGASLDEGEISNWARRIVDRWSGRRRRRSATPPPKSKVPLRDRVRRVLRETAPDRFRQTTCSADFGDKSDLGVHANYVNPAKTAMDNETFQCFVRAITRIKNDDQKRLLHLVVMEGWTIGEAAREFGVPPGTMYAHRWPDAINVLLREYRIVRREWPGKGDLR